MIVLLGIAVFLGAIALDFADAKNTQAVAERHPHVAARWSIAMYVVGLVGFFSVLRVSVWLAIPECLGLYVGSWLAVRRPSREATRRPVSCTGMSTRFTYETRRPCKDCRREVDAVRASDAPGLRLSRHFRPVTNGERMTFCSGSLVEAPR